ncbi:MAG TPA: hypothetical protein VMI54_10530 [Polyangiaceae bacterium]|nr:hypothetical protein [Polyangiaceae bacterium]
MKGLTVVGALAAACALSGCGGDNGPPDVAVVGDGVLDVDWTIGDSKDPGACSANAADSIDVVVTTASGDVVGDFNAHCEDFVISIELAPGTYTGDATLLDPGGQPRTTPVELGSFDIQGDDELDIPIDFPLDSFY